MIDLETHKSLRTVRQRGGRARYELFRAIGGGWMRSAIYSNLVGVDAIARRHKAVSEMEADPEFSGDASWRRDGTIEDGVTGTVYGRGPVETFIGGFVS